MFKISFLSLFQKLPNQTLFNFSKKNQSIQKPKNSEKKKCFFFHFFFLIFGIRKGLILLIFFMKIN